MHVFDIGTPGRKKRDLFLIIERGGGRIETEPKSSTLYKEKGTSSEKGDNVFLN